MLCLDEAARLKPDEAVTYREKGITLAQLGRHDEAAGCLETAVSLKPGSAHMRIVRGIMLISSGRHGEAAECLDGAIKISPHDPHAHVQKARALEGMGDRAGAIECCKKMLGWENVGRLPREDAPGTPLTACRLADGPSNSVIFNARIGWSLPGSTFLNSAGLMRQATRIFQDPP